MSKTRILVVEDEAIVGMGIKQKLEDLGHEVLDIVFTGEDAVKRALETKPDIILMDIVPKGNMDGIEAASMIRDHLDVPIIYLTAYSDEDVLNRAKITEPYGYILKPFKTVQALAPIQRVLDSHPASVLISDGGEFGQWAQAVLHAPRRLINGSAGSIGSGLPFALGARCAVGAGVPVVAVIGDGTCGFQLAEIDTGVRHVLPAVTLVGNDARWNAEVQIQVREYGADRALGCELLPTRYDLAAAALGGHGEWITDAADLPVALDRALASGRPACVNVMKNPILSTLCRRTAQE